MGKKKNSGNLGKSIIRDKIGSSKGKKLAGDSSMLHTSELNDGYDWGRLNLQSVTEENSFADFLATAELAGTEFQAEKLNIKFINPKARIGLLTQAEKVKIREAQDENKKFLQIPRRPVWDVTTSAEKLQSNEKEAFLEWRRQLATLQELDGIILTPYEKNLEFWRQLWRVVERSDVVVQIVDARNPLLFRCEDLESYVKEVSPHKMNMILLNKADYLTESQRHAWANYFSERDIKVAFFSAVSEEDSDHDSEDEDQVIKETDNAESIDKESNSNHRCNEQESNNESDEEGNENLKGENENNTSKVHQIDCTSTVSATLDTVDKANKTVTNSSAILKRHELVALFKTLHTGPKVQGGLTTVGLVGYPNVGKSSTINNILTYKKVSVSATPGKTKHFQTLYIDNELMLCDCPGLVMPTFVSTKAEMVVSGILPIDQMRDHVPPITLVASRIPRHVFERTYGIMIPEPQEGEEPDRPPTSEELLNAYGYNRGFMTSRGMPDNPRSSRYILKDFVNGKLLYCHAPPGYDQIEFHPFPEIKKLEKHDPEVKRVIPPQLKATCLNRTSVETLDHSFFQKISISAHTKGINGIKGYSKLTNLPGQHSSSQSSEAGSSSCQPVIAGKPWKKHNNKNKREKLRRVYAHLDQ